MRGEEMIGKLRAVCYADGICREIMEYDGDKLVVPGHLRSQSRTIADFFGGCTERYGKLPGFRMIVEKIDVGQLKP
jgi:hypothetical protein